MWRTCAPNTGVFMTSSGRGRGWSTRMSSSSRPGRAVITSTRSARNTASGIECVMNSTVFCRSIQMRCSSRFMCSRVMASRAPKGSSISSMAGSCTSARVMATRCCMPPESSHGYLPSKPLRPTRVRRSTPTCSCLARPRRCTSTGSSTLSSTVRHGKRTGDWKTTPMSLRGPAMSVPRSNASPLEEVRIPARIFSSVDLPQPEGPTTATNSPSPTENVARSSAATAPLRVAYVFDRLRTVIAWVPTAMQKRSVHPVSAGSARGSPSHPHERDADGQDPTDTEAVLPDDLPAEHRVQP